MQSLRLNLYLWVIIIDILDVGSMLPFEYFLDRAGTSLLKFSTPLLSTVHEERFIYSSCFILIPSIERKLTMHCGSRYQSDSATAARLLCRNVVHE